MAVQVRNDELVSLLTPDFVRNQPQGFWHAHRVNVPPAITVEIPAEHQLVIHGNFTVNGALNIQGELVVL